MEWKDITYFGKGLIIGLVSWIILIVIILLQKFYLSYNTYLMNPSIFYVFGSVGFTFLQIVYIGLFLIVVLGGIGWLYGRVVGERV